MPGVIPRFTTGPVTYTVAEAVKGGQLVEARAGGKIGVAGDGSLKVLGVATRDARPPQSATGTTADGFPVLNVEANISEFVAVGCFAQYPVVFAEAAAFGDRLAAAANGQVRRFRDTDPDATGALIADTASALIGVCTEPNGVAAGATGLAKILV